MSESFLFLWAVLACPFGFILGVLKSSYDKYEFEKELWAKFKRRTTKNE